MPSKIATKLNECMSVCNKSDKSHDEEMNHPLNVWFKGLSAIFQDEKQKIKIAYKTMHILMTGGGY